MSTKIKEIGVFPQCNKGIFVSTWDSEKSILKAFMTQIEDTEIEIPEFVLNPKAILTDLISASFLHFKLLLSSRIKEIIENTGYSGIQFFKTRVHSGRNVESNYWILNPFEFRNNYIDFDNTIIKCRIKSEVSFLKVKTNDQLSELVGKSISTNANYVIDKLSLNPDNLKEDFFILDYVSGGIGYFISERLRKEITNSKCTGIEYEKIDQ